MNLRVIVSTSLVFCALCSVQASSQSYRIERDPALGRQNQQSAKRPNVLRALKLSAAQREEIVSIVSSLQTDTKTLQRKKELLQEDYTTASLQENPSEKDLLRIQADIQSAQAEINALALTKMASIKALLSKTQLAVLSDLRTNERERLIAEQKNKQGDAVSQGNRRIPATQAFSIQSWTSSGGQKLIDADQLFVYPDRELWMDGASMGAFSFSNNEDGDLFGQPFENFFGDQGFNFQMPQFRQFEQPNTDGSDLMDDTPYTLPKNNDRTQQAPQVESDRSMRQQLEELKSKLRKLEKQLDKPKDGRSDD